MSNFIVIIPARMNSFRLPQKMILDVGEVPLIIRTARQALKSKATHVVVATDHEEIRSLCEKHDIRAIMTSSKHQSGTDRLCETVQLLNLSNREQIIINVQGDELFIDPCLINELADFISNKKSHMATVAYPVTNEKEIFNPNIVKVVLDSLQNALYFSRAPIPFHRDGCQTTLNCLRHIGIYGYTVKFLENYSQMAECTLEQIECLEQLRVLYNGFKIAVLISKNNHEAGIDTLDDLNRAREKFAEKEHN